MVNGFRLYNFIRGMSFLFSFDHMLAHACDVQKSFLLFDYTQI